MKQDINIHPHTMNRYRLKTYGIVDNTSLNLLCTNLVSVDITKNSENHYFDIEMVFDEYALYTGLFNTLFSNKKIPIIEIELIGMGDQPTKIISIRDILSTDVEYKLSYASSTITKIKLKINAIDVQQFNTEESVQEFPSSSHQILSNIRLQQF